MQPPFSNRLRIWFLALRPFAYTASILPVLLGFVLSRYAGYRLDLVTAGLLLVGVLALHTAANLWNDLFDYRRGLDRTVHPASGALVRGWLSEGQIRRGAWISLFGGIAAAAGVLARSGPGVLWMGAAGLLLACTYTRGGTCLKYLGLGDPAILIAFGLLPVLTAWWVQTETWSLFPIVWSAPPGVLAVGILHANNWRDRENDAAKGCRTLAVRLGPVGSRRYFQILVLLPWVLVMLYALLGFAGIALFRVPFPVGAVLVLLPAGWNLAARDWETTGEQYLALDARVARLHTLFGVVLILGFLLGMEMSL